MPFEWTPDNIAMAIQIGIAAVALFVVANLLVAKSLGQMATPERYLTAHPGGHAGMAADPNYAWIAEWADAHDFRPEVVADFNAPAAGATIRIMVWKNEYRKTFLAAYYGGPFKYQEFLTMLSGDGMLTTSGSRDSHVVPTPPGSYVQTFHRADLATLFHRHEAALVYLHEHFGLTPIASWKSTPELIVETVRRQIAYVKTLPLWQMRGLYWNFIRKYRLGNRTIAQLYPADQDAGLNVP